MKKTENSFNSSSIIIIHLFLYAGAFPHAYQPGAAGMCVPGVSHAAGNPLHGRP